MTARRTAAALAVVLAGAACAAVPAAALPGDPPIAPLSPADGAVVPGGAAGVTVAFSCPPYRSLDDGEPGGPEDYRVVFSRRPGLDEEGDLAGFLDREVATPRPDGTCTSLLDIDDSATSPQVVGGRVYWQVARSCAGCADGGDEHGPVRSFVVRPAIRGSLAAPPRLYAGYLAAFTVRVPGALNGSRVVLERRAGARLIAVAEAVAGRGAPLVAALPAGRQALRAAVVTPGGRIAVASRTVVVRPAGAPRSVTAAADGPYRSRAGSLGTVRFTVADGGRLLRGFRATVRLACVTVAPSRGRAAAQVAALASARVAPDGSVTGVVRAGALARVVLTGRLVDGRFRGRVAISSRACRGARSIDAARTS